MARLGRSLRGDAYTSNLMINIGGSVLTQVISFSLNPILTRVLTPADFGTYAVFVSAVGVLGMVSVGRYDQAVMLPHGEEEADALVILCLVISTLVGLVLGLGLLILPDEILSGALHLSASASWALLLAPAVALGGLSGALQQRLSRRGAYPALTRNRLLQAILTFGSSVALALAGFHEIALILGYVTGLFISTALMLVDFIVRSRASVFSADLAKRLRGLAIRYRNHPLHLMPGQWIGVAAMNAPVFVITTAFGPAAAGFYHLAYRVIAMPTSLIGNALGDVYRQHAAETFRREGAFDGLFVRTLAMTAALGAAPLVVLLAAAPFLFGLVFGPEWRTAGEYAAILSVFSYAQFAVLPVDKSALIIGATGYIVLWNIGAVALIGALAGAVFGLHWSITSFLVGLSASLALLYVLDGVVQYRFSRRHGTGVHV